jgi:hypothetical protein
VNRGFFSVFSSRRTGIHPQEEWLGFRQSGRNFLESSLVLARNSNSLSKWTFFFKI